MKTRNQIKVQAKVEAKKESASPVIKKQLVPKIIDKVNIRRKIANRPEYENIDMKIYEYKNANVSANKINAFVQGVVAKLNAQGLDVKVNTTIKTPLGWKSGRLTSNAQPIKVWSPSWGTDDKNGDELMDWYDDGEGIVENFDIFIQATEKNKKKGGSDENNDCLYNCLFSLLKETLTDKWKHAGKLKKALKIERNDMINANSHIDFIEKKLNVGIFIEGDEIREPKIKAKTSVNLILFDNHFSTKKEKKQHEPLFSFTEKKPIFYHYCKETNIFHYYDGQGLHEEDKDTFLPKVSYAERLKGDYFYLKCAKKDELKYMYDDFVYNADELKKYTKNRINMYKTFSIKNTALKIFYDLIQHVEEPEKIDDIEGEFIMGCYRGGLLFHNKYTGPAWKGDVCSMYPSLMCSNVMYPTKRGEFHTISQDDLLNMKDRKTGEQIFKSGIYRAVITSNKNSINKLFQLNKNNYYTHIDMLQAHQLKFDIKVLEDTKPNFLHYAPDKMLKGSSIFKHYVEFLFKLKSKHPKITFAKRILNILWGALCENRVSGKYTIYDDIETNITLKENEEITSVKKYENGVRIIECEEVGNRFLSGFARIGPFLTSHGRRMIGNLAIEHVKDLNNIQRIYTDCILASEPLHIKDKEQCELGDFGLEHGKTNVEVFNALKVITK